MTVGVCVGVNLVVFGEVGPNAVGGKQEDLGMVLVLPRKAVSSGLLVWLSTECVWSGPLASVCLGGGDRRVQVAMVSSCRAFSTYPPWQL